MTDPNTRLAEIASAQMDALGGCEVSWNEYLGVWQADISGLEIGGNGLLESVWESGDSPQAAIIGLRDKLQRVSTEPFDHGSPRYLVRDAMSRDRKQFRWQTGGFHEYSGYGSTRKDR